MPLHDPYMSAAHEAPARAEVATDLASESREGVTPPEGRHHSAIQGKLELLMVIAAVSMVVDHSVKEGLLPHLGVLQIFGRVAFPLFAICLAARLGLARLDSEEAIGPACQRQMRRLLIGLLVSTPIYLMARTLPEDAAVFNVLGTMLVSVFVISLLDTDDGRRFARRMLARLDLHASAVHVRWWRFFMAAAVVVATSGMVDYGAQGVLFIVSVYWAVSRRGGMVVVAAFWLGILCSLSWDAENLSVIGGPVLTLFLLAMVFAGPLRLPRLPRLWGHYFYPAHLLLIWILK